MNSCKLFGEDSTGIIVEKVENNYVIRLALNSSLLSIEMEDPYSVEFVLLDLAACAITMGKMDDRLSMTVRTGDHPDSHYNNIDTPFYIDYDLIDIMVFHKPRSHDKLPVTFNISICGSDWITIRTTKDHFERFGLQLKELIGEEL